jgi:phosphoglycerol transferase MdoB-like AlkP superfamily enzyme
MNKEIVKIIIKNHRKHTIIKLLKLYTLSIGVFLIFRLLLLITEWDRVSFVSGSLHNIFYSLLIGLRFDLVITGYILLLPALILFISDIFRINSKLLQKFVVGFVAILMGLSIVISSADIPFFKQFFSRFSIVAFEWMDNPRIVFAMILEQYQYLLYVIPVIILNVIYYRVLKKIIGTPRKSDLHILVKIPLYLFVLVIMFVGIRGRISNKPPIVQGEAYFCNNAFLNQLGLNPVFTLIRSYLDEKASEDSAITLMDSKCAQDKLQEYFDTKFDTTISPVARYVIPEIENDNRPNVIIILMESMSVAKMGRHGNNNGLTPFLDSLTYQGIYFSNFHAAGKHTYNGIFSTLFSYPGLFQQHTMKQLRNYNGLSSVLSQYGYYNLYFTTHDGNFDNVEGFLLHNDFDRVISEKDYPEEEIRTSLGVPDDYMFRFSIPILNKLYAKDNPFLSVFMTVSDHAPFYIPSYFKPTAKRVTQQITQYADWSLREFFNLASCQPWFHNTIFLLLADHGAPMTSNYDISLAYHHIPFLIYAPKIIPQPLVVDNIGSQIDVFPTLMGFLNYTYLNNTMGIDLLKEKRSYALLNDDNKVGVIGEEYLYIYYPGQESKLHRYINADVTNCSKTNAKKALDMEMYLKSYLQVYQDMLMKQQTFL